MEGRVDKKVQVAPYVPTWMKEIVHDIGRFKRLPDGHIARAIVLTARQDIPTLNRLSPYFWRDLDDKGAAWIGHEKHDDLNDLISWRTDRVERLKIRFTRAEYKYVDELAFALARPFAHAIAVLVAMGIRDERIVSTVAPGFVVRSPFSFREGTFQWR